MIVSPSHLSGTSALLAMAAAAALSMLAAGCGTTVHATDPSSGTEQAEQGDAPADTTVVRAGAGDAAGTVAEREFLDDLTAFGLPTELTAATTVEVGIGICQGIDDGVDTETILDRIRPLTSALAAQDAAHDTTEVGRALIEASRAHLCD